jgi:hypothetical protein
VGQHGCVSQPAELRIALPATDCPTRVNLSLSGRLTRASGPVSTPVAVILRRLAATLELSTNSLQLRNQPDSDLRWVRKDCRIAVRVAGVSTTLRDANVADVAQTAAFGGLRLFGADTTNNRRLTACAGRSLSPRQEGLQGLPGQGNLRKTWRSFQLPFHEKRVRHGGAHEHQPCLSLK